MPRTDDAIADTERSALDFSNTLLLLCFALTAGSANDLRKNDRLPARKRREDDRTVVDEFRARMQRVMDGAKD